MKTCSRCKEVKEFSEFNKNKNSKDGYGWWCKQCYSQHYKNKKINPELQLKAIITSSVRLDNKILFKEGKRFCNTCNQVYLLEDKSGNVCSSCKKISNKLFRDSEQGKNHRKIYVTENKDKMLTYKREWIEKNRDMINEKKREWKAKNKDKVNKQQREYMARKKAEKLKQLEEKL